jgi:hypothetical protein
VVFVEQSQLLSICLQGITTTVEEKNTIDGKEEENENGKRGEKAEEPRTIGIIASLIKGWWGT